MRYREAKTLVKDDIVIRKVDNQKLVVINTELYGQFKLCKVNCYILKNDSIIYLSAFNDEIDFNDFL